MRSVALLIIVLFLGLTAHAQMAPEAPVLTKMLNEFLDGASRNDAAVHDRFWAEDLIYTRGGGQRTTKAEIMKSVRSAPAPRADDPKTVYTAEDVLIQQFGSTAVVAFRLVGKTNSPGNTSVQQFYNTGTFVKRRGRWQAVAWQATKIPGNEEDNRSSVAKVEAEFQRSILAGDTKSLERIVHPSFIWTHTTGAKDNREKLLGDITSGKLKYSKLETQDVTINIYGDAAVVRGVSPRQRIQAKGPGNPFTVFYTITLINVGGSWKIAALHT
ncbi:MAG TPA: nuclear transport factor 2 family protein, partial [Pyrinomonadaceae bacterium]|nr:nuclear transport factor 2 family protein [Pyrinomonadaceae bacterium]